MNEQPEFDRSEIVLVCMRDGKFLAEDGDGKATWIDWVDSPLQAKIFAHIRGDAGVVLDEIKEPGYYQSWPGIPEGAKMVALRLSITGWHLRSGPAQPKPRTWIEDNPFYQMLVKESIHQREKP